MFSGDHAVCFQEILALDGQQAWHVAEGHGRVLQGLEHAK